MTPQRIQLSRAKGWRMPENTVNCARGPGRIFGNPFTVAKLRDAGYNGSDDAATLHCVNSFADWLGGSIRDWMGEKSDLARAAIMDNIADLRGKNLACWCKPGTPCHADVLLELANAPRDNRDRDAQNDRG